MPEMSIKALLAARETSGTPDTLTAEAVLKHSFELLSNDTEGLELRDVYKKMSPLEWIRIARGDVVNVKVRYGTKKGTGFQVYQCEYLYADENMKALGVQKDGWFYTTKNEKRTVNKNTTVDSALENSYSDEKSFLASVAEGYLLMNPEEKAKPVDFESGFEIIRNYFSLYQSKLAGITGCEEAFRTQVDEFIKDYLDEILESLLNLEDGTQERQAFNTLLVDLLKATGRSEAELAPLMFLLEDTIQTKASTNPFFNEVSTNQPGPLYVYKALRRHAIENILANNAKAAGQGASDKLHDEANEALAQKNLTSSKLGMSFVQMTSESKKVKPEINRNDLDSFVFKALVAYRESDRIEAFLVKELERENAYDKKNHLYLVLEKLLQKGVDSPHILKALVEKNGLNLSDAFKHQYNGRRENLLHLCARYGANNVARFILAQIDQDVNEIIYRENVEGKTPVEVAALENNISVAATIIHEGGADAKLAKKLLKENGLVQLKVAYQKERRVRKSEVVRSIVFQGGGVKGNSEIYALEYAIKNSKTVDLDEVDVYSGTSAGSINALVLACGYGIEGMKEIAETIPLGELADVSEKLVKGGSYQELEKKMAALVKELKEAIGGAQSYAGLVGLFMQYFWGGKDNLIQKVMSFLSEIGSAGGICEGQKLLDTFREKVNHQLKLLKSEIKTKDDRLSSEIVKLIDSVINSNGARDITLEEWGAIVRYTREMKTGVQFRHLRVCAVRCKDGKKNAGNRVDFCTDNPTDETANVPVVMAVRASMSIPFFFKATTINGLDYVDGGVANNLPLDLALKRFDRKGHYEDNEVLGLALGLPSTEILGEPGMPETAQQNKGKIKREASSEAAKKADQKQLDEKSTSIFDFVTFLKDDLLAQILPVISQQEANLEHNLAFQERCARVDIADVGTVEFNMSDAQKKRQKYGAVFSMKQFEDRTLQEFDGDISQRLKAALAQYVKASSLNNALEKLTPEQVLDIYLHAEDSDLPFLRRVVNPNQCNDQVGLTALHIARACGFNRTAGFLEQAGANKAAKTTTRKHVVGDAALDRAELKKTYGIEILVKDEKKLRKSKHTLVAEHEANLEVVEELKRLNAELASKLGDALKQVQAVEVDKAQILRDKAALQVAVGEQRQKENDLTLNLDRVSRELKATAEENVANADAKATRDKRVTELLNELEQLRRGKDDLEQARVRLVDEAKALKAKEKADEARAKELHDKIEVAKRLKKEAKRQARKFEDRIEELEEQLDRKTQKRQSAQGKIRKGLKLLRKMKEKDSPSVVMAKSRRLKVMGASILVLGLFLMAAVGVTAGLLVGGVFSIYIIPPIAIFGIGAALSALACGLMIGGVHNLELGQAASQYNAGRRAAQNELQREVGDLLEPALESVTDGEATLLREVRNAFSPVNSLRSSYASVMHSPVSSLDADEARDLQPDPKSTPTTSDTKSLQSNDESDSESSSEVSLSVERSGKDARRPNDSTVVKTSPAQLFGEALQEGDTDDTARTDHISALVERMLAGARRDARTNQDRSRYSLHAQSCSFEAAKAHSAGHEAASMPSVVFPVAV